MFLHEPGMLHPAEGVTASALHALIPWIGVMALGYAVGPVMLWKVERQRAWLLAAGIAALAGFHILRASNTYGDPGVWTVEDGLLATVLSMVNCKKTRRCSCTWR
jgi:uncharacterized membrane protein